MKKSIETINEFMEEEGLLKESSINTTDEEINDFKLLERLKEKFNKGNNKFDKKIEELEAIRVRITSLYLSLGNKDWMEADLVLKKEIIKLEGLEKGELKNE